MNQNNFRIEKYNTLTDQQKKEITALEQQAFRKDGLENHVFLSSEINFDQTLPCFFLCYEEALLVGFLTIFMPTREEGEISAFTHPEYQRQGIFTLLLQQAKNVLKETEVDHIVYCVEPRGSSAQEILKAFAVTEIERSEYRMEITRVQVKDRSVRTDLRIEKATQENVEEFARISRDAYDEEDHDAAIDKAVTSEERRGYLLYDGEMPVGVFVLGLEDEVFIYGVGMDSRFKGMGYGKELVQKALELGFEKGDKVVLDVDSDNPVAFHLYEEAGFVVTFQVDYYVQKI